MGRIRTLQRGKFDRAVSRWRGPLNFFVIIIACTFVGAMIGYISGSNLFKPIEPGSRIDGLGIILISITMMIPTIIGGVMGLIMGFVIAVASPETSSRWSSGPTSTQTLIAPAVEDQRASKAIESQRPFRPSKFESLKTKIIEPHLKRKL